MAAFRNPFSHKVMYSNERIELVLSGRDETDSECGILDSYVFDIFLRNTRTRIGYISIRLGESPQLYYLGHIGYRIQPPFRGNHYAVQACELILPLLRRIAKSSIVITTDPDNTPSKKTCEKLGCILERTVPVPSAYRTVCNGSVQKTRFIWVM